MKTIFNKGFQGKVITQNGRPMPMQVQPTFGGQAPQAPGPAPMAAPGAQRGVAQPQAGPSLPGRTPIPVIKKGSGGPSCPVCRG